MLQQVSESKHVFLIGLPSKKDYPSNYFLGDTRSIFSDMKEIIR